MSKEEIMAKYDANGEISIIQSSDYAKEPEKKEEPAQVNDVASDLASSGAIGPELVNNDIEASVTPEQPASLDSNPLDMVSQSINMNTTFETEPAIVPNENVTIYKEPESIDQSIAKVTDIFVKAAKDELAEPAKTSVVMNKKLLSWGRRLIDEHGAPTKFVKEFEGIEREYNGLKEATTEEDVYSQVDVTLPYYGEDQDPEKQMAA